VLQDELAGIGQVFIFDCIVWVYGEDPGPKPRFVACLVTPPSYVDCAHRYHHEGWSVTPWSVGFAIVSDPCQCVMLTGPEVAPMSLEFKICGVCKGWSEGHSGKARCYLTPGLQMIWRNISGRQGWSVRLHDDSGVSPQDGKSFDFGLELDVFVFGRRSLCMCFGSKDWSEEEDEGSARVVRIMVTNWRSLQKLSVWELFEIGMFSNIR